MSVNAECQQDMIAGYLKVGLSPALLVPIVKLAAMKRRALNSLVAGLGIKWENTEKWFVTGVKLSKTPFSEGGVVAIYALVTHGYMRGGLCGLWGNLVGVAASVKKPTVWGELVAAEGCHGRAGGGGEILIRALRSNVAQNVVQTNPNQPQYSPNMGNIGILSSWKKYKIWWRRRESNP